MLELMTAPAQVGTRFMEVVLLGDSDADRRGDREPVVTSSCEYRFRDDISLERCIAVLRASDLRLSQDPDRQYDWHRTMVANDPTGAGGTIYFCVSWYDEAFFQDNREVFLGGMHQRMYENFGITDADVTVRHWRAA